jgi:hypothetical protein
VSAEEAKAGEIALSDGEIAALSWIKAKASSHNGACVEIAAARGNIAIRDSKDPGGPVLLYTPAEFAAFIDGARNGDFDALLRLSSRFVATTIGPACRYWHSYDRW